MDTTVYRISRLEAMLADLAQQNIQFIELAPYLRRKQPYGLVTEEGNTVVLTGRQNERDSALTFILMKEWREKDGTPCEHFRMRFAGSADYYFVGEAEN
mgnify:CR=1 FL=1